MDRLGKTDVQVAREREEEAKREAKGQGCVGCYWEAKSGGRSPYCRRGYDYGNRCREFKR